MTPQNGSWLDDENEAESRGNAALSRLQNDLTARRDTFRQQMMQLSEKLDGAVVVPPITVNV